MTAEDILILDYYGTYSGYTIVQIFFKNVQMVFDEAAVRIGAYEFIFNSSTSPYFLAYKDGKMLKVKDAYEQGLLTEEDIIQLAVFRDEIISPDKCVNHEIMYVDEIYPTNLSQGYIGRMKCEKCYTLLQEGWWVPTVSHTRFDDVRNAWCCESVDYCDIHGIMVGMNETQFKPNYQITRGEFITALHRLAGSPTAVQTGSFTDVAEDSYYAKAVAWGVEKGIVYGTTETTYSPDSWITREDIACLIARYAKAVKADFLYDDEIYPLPDINIEGMSEYALESYHIVASEGIMIGNANGMFYPQYPITRAETATVFMNLDRKFKGPEETYLQVGEGETAWVYTLSEQDALRFKELLDLENEVWTEELLCECIGECQLFLDGVRYIIDWDDLTHQVKYEALYGGVSGAAVTKDADTLNELGMMLLNFKFIYELTK